MRRFEFAEGSSNKFWAIGLDGSSFTVNYGRVGTAGQTQVKSFATAEAALKEHDKLIAEKTKKGYQEVGGNHQVTAPAPAAVPKPVKSSPAIIPAPAPTEAPAPVAASIPQEVTPPAVTTSAPAAPAGEPIPPPSTPAQAAPPAPAPAATPEAPTSPPVPVAVQSPPAPKPSIWSSMVSAVKGAIQAVTAPSEPPAQAPPEKIDLTGYDGTVWKNGEHGEPHFPADFEIVKKAVLQMTDLKTNKNKYYAVELHRASGNRFRVFTHYGRTDDLETNPNAGQRECRYLPDVGQAEHEYQRIYGQKTGAGKGYKEVSLASSKIGSQRAIGTSSGTIDNKTLEKLQGEGKVERPKVELPHPEVQDLVRYIYSEATNALTATVNAKITAQGIETPLGILTIGQIEKGEQILTELYGLFQKGASPDTLEHYSGLFYSCIPHRLGRTKAAVSEAVIASLADFEQKQETLQLMKDMLQVNGDQGDVLYGEEVGSQFKALNCQIVPLSGEEMRKWADFIVKSQVKSHKVQVKRVFQIRRAGEWERFREDIPNQRMLLHGSRIKNWVGVLSRGILLPKIVVSMGVKRTDAGWLGNGIYFGDTACTAAFYTTPGKRSTRFMAIARVALGKSKDYHQITYGLNSPPAGYQSCHGVRRVPGVNSQFDDDEYVVYELNQQRLEYLVEFTC